jgi:cyclic pyranopterin phosphate synthase
VDVGDKAITTRIAVAECTVVLGAAIMAELAGQDFNTKKGSVIQTAIIAGTMAVKQTWSVIPLCHALDISSIKFDIQAADQGAAAGDALNRSNRTSTPFSRTAKKVGEALHVTCRVKSEGRTGVEMEALHGCSVAALTIYDMCKAMSHDIEVNGLRLVSKTGGKMDFLKSEVG